MAFYRRCFFSAEIVVLNTFLSVMSTFLSAPITSTSSYRSTTSSDAVSRSLFNLSISEVSIFLLGLSHYVFAPVVTESHFFNLETRMRVSPIQSRSSRRDREFLTLTLRLRDETEKKFPPISGIETRSRFIIFTLRLRDENENSLDLISFFETRPRILKLAIFP